MLEPEWKCAENGPCLLKLDRLSKQVREMFETLLDGERQMHMDVSKEGGFDYDDPYADVRLYSDKEMVAEILDGPGLSGVMPKLVPKKKNSRCLLVVTFDGAGYDYLSSNAEYGGGITTHKFRKLLMAAKLPVFIEDYCNWAFVVYADD